MLFRAAYDFRVTRRIEWSDDLAGFHGHIDRVREHIEARKRTNDVRAIADISESCLTLDFLIEGDDDQTAAAEALDIVSLAIRECGARHDGLYPVAQESQLKSRVNAFSGLRTPMWQPRNIRIAAAA
ncbi:MAG: hypothetical protein U9N84_08750 [Actinomycetota bacterium]|nr:hypothetical protein [Actinomycetota bacterium]